MPYQFAHERPDYSDLASGQVLYSAAGRPAFPIRLASEILQRCLAHRAAQQLTEPCSLYDPCCGAAYQLSVLAYLHRPALRAVLGSDIDPAAVALARQNLSLLNLAGLDQRIVEIEALFRRYGKPSHQAALASARRLRRQLADSSAAAPLTTLATLAFQADALDRRALCEHLPGTTVDIVITDVPYGQRSHWGQADDRAGVTAPLELMLAALLGVVGPASLVAVVTDKGQKAAQVGYQRVEHFQMGKRRVVILKPLV